MKKGDSGGPLVVQSKKNLTNFKNKNINYIIKKDNGRWYLDGITSYGYYGCSETGVFTRASNYYDWILSNIRLTIDPKSCNFKLNIILDNLSIV